MPLRLKQLSFSLSISLGVSTGGGFCCARAVPAAKKIATNDKCRTGPPSPMLPRTLLTLDLAFALRRFRPFPGLLGLSRFSRHPCALGMQERGHLLQVFAGLKLGLNLGDIGQFLSGLQERFLDLVKMLDLVLDQGGDEPAVIVRTLW